jgi:hypothetical protein
LVLEYIKNHTPKAQREREQLPSIAAALTDGKNTLLDPGSSPAKGNRRQRGFSALGVRWVLSCAPGSRYYDGVPCTINALLEKRDDVWVWVCRSVDDKGSVDGDWEYVVRPDGLDRQDKISKNVNNCKAAYPENKE